MTQQFQAGQDTGSAEAEELKAKLQALLEEKQRLEDTHSRDVAAFQARQEEEGAVVSRLTAEGEGLRAKLLEVEASKDVVLSEVASLQADLATANSERNTQQMATEAVSAMRGCGQWQRMQYG